MGGKRRDGADGLRRLFPVLFVLLISEFDVIQEVIVGCPFAKLVGRTVFYHEGIQFVAIQPSSFFDDVFAEAMVDKLVLFFFDQPFLEGHHSFGPLKTEDIYQFVQVYSGAQASVGGWVGDLESRFFKIEYLLIIFPVLQRVHPVVLRHDLYLLQFERVYVQGDIKTGGRVDVADGIFGGSPAEIGEPDRVFPSYLDGVVAIGIGGSSITRGTDDADPVQGTGPVHIIYGTFYGHLLSPDLPPAKDRQ